MTDSDPNDASEKRSRECFPEVQTERISVIISEIPIGASVGDLPVNYSAAFQRTTSTSSDDDDPPSIAKRFQDNFDCNTLDEDEITCSTYAGSSHFAAITMIGRSSASAASSQCGDNDSNQSKTTCYRIVPTRGFCPSRVTTTSTTSSKTCSIWSLLEVVPCQE
jgi:hypothetical protein